MPICKDEIINEALTPEERGVLHNLTLKMESEWIRHCPNHGYFDLHTGKEFGTDIEKAIIDTFDDLRKSQKDTSFDAVGTGGLKVEVKSIRAGTKGYENIYLKSDDIMSANLTNGFFQQVKPSCCDWFALHVLFADGSRMFLVPSSMVSKRAGRLNGEVGKFQLGTQHRGNESEGMLSLKHVLKYASLFEITNYDMCKRYNYDACKSKIMKRLDKIGWKLD